MKWNESTKQLTQGIQLPQAYLPGSNKVEQKVN